jgi:plasmid stabilization system protein ParE
MFEKLPAQVKRKAAHLVSLLSFHPRMYSVRRRGLMRGYRYFVVDRYLFYYSVTSTEIRVTAIIPGAMRRA